MIRLLVVVEGQTEEAVVNRVLQPHLATCGVFAIPTIVETRHLPGRPRDKGGLTSWAKARRDIARCLQDSAARTTTLFDFYGLPDDFPGHGQARMPDPLADVARIEQAMAQDLSDPRFLPFLALHELEAWVLASPSEVGRHFGDAALSSKVERVLGGFESPEYVNHGPETHPARRLEDLVPSYKKRSDGPAILESAGIGRIRSRCAHFAEWLTRLEHLGSA